MPSAPFDAVARRPLDDARPPVPESPAELLRLAGLTDLDGVDLNELERRLRRLTRALQGADALRRRTVRGLLVATLRAAKVGGAAALADAAIGGSCDETDVTATPFLSDEEPWPDHVDAPPSWTRWSRRSGAILCRPMSMLPARSRCGSSSPTVTRP